MAIAKKIRTRKDWKSGFESLETKRLMTGNAVSHPNDFQQVLDNGVVDQAHVEGLITNATDLDRDKAQTITVGETGTVGQVDIAIHRTAEHEGTFEFQVATVNGEGLPDEVLHTKVIAINDLPTTAGEFFTVDLTEAGIQVEAGEQIALIVDVENDEIGEVAQWNYGTGYAGGAFYTRGESIDSITISGTNFIEVRDGTDDPFALGAASPVSFHVTVPLDAVDQHVTSGRTDWARFEPADLTVAIDGELVTATPKSISFVDGAGNDGIQLKVDIDHLGETESISLGANLPDNLFSFDELKASVPQLPEGRWEQSFDSGFYISGSSYGVRLEEGAIVTVAHEGERTAWQLTYASEDGSDGLATNPSDSAMTTADGLFRTYVVPAPEASFGCSWQDPRHTPAAMTSPLQRQGVSGYLNGSVELPPAAELSADQDTITISMDYCRWAEDVRPDDIFGLGASETRYELSPRLAVVEFGPRVTGNTTVMGFDEYLAASAPIETTRLDGDRYRAVATFDISDLEPGDYSAGLGMTEVYHTDVLSEDYNFNTYVPFTIVEPETHECDERIDQDTTVLYPTFTETSTDKTSVGVSRLLFSTAQTFTPEVTGELNRIDVGLTKNSEGDEGLVLVLVSRVDENGNPAEPIASQFVNVSDLPVLGELEPPLLHEIAFDGVTVTEGEQLAIVVTANSNPAVGLVHLNQAGNYAGGQLQYNIDGDWVPSYFHGVSGPLYFRTWVEGSADACDRVLNRGVIAGQVFEDWDGSGSRNEEEIGEDFRVIELLDESGNVVDTQVTHSLDRNGDSQIDPRTEQGLYLFDELAPGNYTVRAVSRPNRVPTSPTGSNETFVSIEEATDVVRNVDFGSRLLGDIDCDGQIRFLDFLTFSQNFGIKEGATWKDGDLTGDGAVNFDDALLFIDSYGARSSAEAVDSVFANA